MQLSRALEMTFIGVVSKLSYRIAIPQDIATKTFEYYLRVISNLVRGLYRGDIEEGDFIGGMADLIQAQLTRAWNEGMRENGLDPAQDMEPEWQAILDKIILDEYGYVDNFAADIVAARDEQLPWEPLLARAGLWANRYTEVVNQAILITKEQKLIWIYGDTVVHCDNCKYLHGIVAWASEWEKSGIRPQSRDLQCGGYHCKCQLIPTTNRRTRNALEAIREAMAKG